MNNLPRETLRGILVKHGREIAGNAERCQGLLNDLCGDYRREINVLVTAVEERIPLDLLAGARSMPINLLLARLEKRLADQTGLTPEAARWAVGSWALALDAATQAEIAARESKSGNYPVGEAAQSQSITDDESKSANQNAPEVEMTGNDQSPKTRTKQLPAKRPPDGGQPVNIPPASFPPIHLPANNQSPNLPGGSGYAPAPKSRSWLFRGCLIFVFMLIVSFVVLLFGVPFAVEKMRETQRERQNEPPRFPAR